MFNNFTEAQCQLANAGAYLLFAALNEKYGDWETQPENLEAALKDCTDAANWMIECGHGSALSASLESLEAMTWFITKEQDRKAHEEWCCAQYKEWNEWSFAQAEKAEKESAPLQSEETQQIAAKLNGLLAL